MKMGRILAIDYGEKRVGLAMSDPDRIIASPYDTTSREGIETYLKDLFSRYDISEVVIGWPINMDGSEGNMIDTIKKFVELLEKQFANIKIYKQDERLTSRIASGIIAGSGMNKKRRSDKKNIDKISACLILQSFMNKASRY